MLTYAYSPSRYIKLYDDMVKYCVCGTVSCSKKLVVNTVASCIPYSDGFYWPQYLVFILRHTMGCHGYANSS